MLKIHLKLTKMIGRDQKSSAVWRTEGEGRTEKRRTETNVGAGGNSETLLPYFPKEIRL